MPIYEYLCQDCGGKFEKLVRRSSEAAEVRCPSCGQPHVTLQLSTFAAHARSRGPATAPACPGGVCRTPEICGMNN